MVENLKEFVFYALLACLLASEISGCSSEPKTGERVTRPLLTISALDGSGELPESAKWLAQSLGRYLAESHEAPVAGYSDTAQEHPRKSGRGTGHGGHKGRSFGDGSVPSKSDGASPRAPLRRYLVNGAVGIESVAADSAMQIPKSLA